jgi:hypothetical protein
VRFASNDLRAEALWRDERQFSVLLDEVAVFQDRRLVFKREQDHGQEADLADAPARARAD